jgi:hypothetical protein
MKYDFKIGPEAIWFILTAGATAALQFIEGSAKPDDIGTWLIALGAATVRALIGALLDALNPKV